MSSPVASALTGVQPAGLLLAPKPELAIGWVIGFAAAKLFAHFLTVALTPYEIHRDEFLYLAMGQHLHLWYMDFPPAIALLAKAARLVFGDTLFAVRFFPAVAGAAIVVLGALLARELGGGRAAQVIAMVALLFSPIFVRPAALFHPVVWDQLWWTLGFFALAKCLQEERPRWWVLLGLAGGFGLLTKFSILFFAFAALVAVLLSPQRRWLGARWLWVAAAVALAVGSPTLVGQIRLHFPVLVHMTDLKDAQLKRVTADEYFFGQVWMLGPAVLLALAGLGLLLKRPQFRVLGFTCLIAFLLLLVLHGKPYYAGPIYPALLAAGSVALLQARGWGGRVLRSLTVGVLVSAGLVMLPFGLPLLPPAVMARYCSAVGLKAAVTTNRGGVLPLPQDYADMLGWRQQAQAVAAQWATLPADQRAQAGLLARNYGQGGALEFYGRRYGLPGRIMVPSSFLLWPPDNSCRTVVTIGIPPTDLSKFFQHVKVTSDFDQPWMVEEERHRPICIASGPIRELREAWKPRQISLKQFLH
jgi:4-amino-4-deoxy-L-arabinose transferase-like glycosyltransferase